MSTFGFTQKSTNRLTVINNENPLKSLKNGLSTNRKKSALTVLNNNSVYSNKKGDCKSFKQLRVLPMKKLGTELKFKSSCQNTTYDLSEEFDHLGCKQFENDSLPPSMTSNIDMLSNFFNCNNDEKSDWFMEDYNNTMINEIKNRFESFGELDEKYSFPSLPIMDFQEICLDF